MNIHINCLGVNLKNEELDGLRVVRDQLIVTRCHSLVEIRMTHVTTVDKEVLLSTTPARIFGLADKSRDFYKRSLNGKRYELLLECMPQEGDNALLETARNETAERCAPIIPE